MTRVESYICDICGAQRSGIVGIPPVYPATRRHIDVCQDCTEKLSHLTRTREGKELLRSIKIPLRTDT